MLLVPITTGVSSAVRIVCVCVCVLFVLCVGSSFFELCKTQNSTFTKCKVYVESVPSSSTFSWPDVVEKDDLQTSDTAASVLISDLIC